MPDRSWFVPADPPRTGIVALEGGDERLTVVAAPGDRTVEVDVTRLRVGAALETVSGFWGAAAQLALRLVAGGRILPGVSPGGFDAWRVGPLDEAEAAAVRDRPQRCRRTRARCRCPAGRCGCRPPSRCCARSSTPSPTP